MISPGSEPSVNHMRGHYAADAGDFQEAINVGLDMWEAAGTMQPQHFGPGRLAEPDLVIWEGLDAWKKTSSWDPYEAFELTKGIFDELARSGDTKIAVFGPLALNFLSESDADQPAVEDVRRQIVGPLSQLPDDELPIAAKHLVEAARQDPRSADALDPGAERQRKVWVTVQDIAAYASGDTFGTPLHDLTGGVERGLVVRAHWSDDESELGEFFSAMAQTYVGLIREGKMSEALARQTMGLPASGTSTDSDHLLGMAALDVLRLHPEVDGTPSMAWGFFPTQGQAEFGGWMATLLVRLSLEGRVEPIPLPSHDPIEERKFNPAPEVDQHGVQHWI